MEVKGREEKRVANRGNISAKGGSFIDISCWVNGEVCKMMGLGLRFSTCVKQTEQ